MEIVQYPHPALRWKSSDVKRIDASMRKTIEEMFELMYAAKGIGLAANQVALPLRLFIMNETGDSQEKDAEFVFINPEITSRKGSALGEEGCLSLPELYAEVRRPNEITVEAFDLDGQGFEITLDDLPARVIQHELDHLDGVLFIDRISESAEKELAPKLADFEIRFRNLQSSGDVPTDEEIVANLEAQVTSLTQG
ncbi:MAG: peptide deformylase [Planctomycetaceae bacterium]|nr:peptide deformylase [Planctomycetaceae bacterium]